MSRRLWTRRYRRDDDRVPWEFWVALLTFLTAMAYVIAEAIKVAQ